jgi:uncharacterized protein (DUF2235 family)
MDNHEGREKQKPPAIKNIVLLSDGTGNSSAKLFKTNVWRLYQALDLTDPTAQVAQYDDGVGTSSSKWLAAVTGAFGFGLKRNVLDLYRFVCRNYSWGPDNGRAAEGAGAGNPAHEDDRIFGFGFSRGAFTIRVVASFIARIGLVRYTGSEEQLQRDAEIAYRE